MNTMLPSAPPAIPSSAPLSAHSKSAGSGGAVLAHILVPIDFSSRSLKTLEYAVALAAKSGGAVHLVHVVEPASFLSGLEYSPLILPESEVMRYWEEMLARTARQEEFEGITISTSVVVGNPEREIVKMAGETSTNLLVVSTHGRTGFAHALLGSTAEHIVRHASCPVLVVRENERDFLRKIEDRPAALGLRKILVPVDLSPSSAATVRYAADFALRFGGDLTLLHCTDVLDLLPEELYPLESRTEVAESIALAARRKLEALAAREIPAGVTVACEVVEGQPVATVPEKAAAGQSNLIVCGAHGHGGLAQLWLGSTAEGFVRHAPCPVLVVRSGTQATAGPR